MQTFADLGLAPILVDALAHRTIIEPTPIQAGAIPVALQGRDVIGLAQTGTGKTLAFSLPIMERMLANDRHVLILVPTRELALQVEESIRAVTKHLNSNIRTISLIGGMPIYRQIRDLKHQPRCIVATPGRLVDLLNQRAVRLDKVGYLVLDEADRMFDMGFAPQVNVIIDQVPGNRQTMLFSATMSAEVAKLAVRCQNDPVRIEVAPAGSSAEKIRQEVCYVGRDQKLSTLKLILSEHKGTTLIFTRTKHGATKLKSLLDANGYSAAEIHSNRSLGQRRAALDGFKAGRYRILVATDIAARGIDVKDIGLVVNFDLPDASEDYIHRIGRTGRAGAEGWAISFATRDQRRDVMNIERLMKREIPLSSFTAQSADLSQQGSYQPREQQQGGYQRRDDRRDDRRPAYPQRRDDRRPAFNSNRPTGIPYRPAEHAAAQGASEDSSVRPNGFIAPRSNKFARRRGR